MDKVLRNELLEKGWASFRQNNFPRALETFKLILSQNPSDWNVWYLAGQCYRFLEDYPTAISSLERALKLNDSSATVCHALGVAYQLNHDYAASLKALEKGRDLEPENEMIYNSYGMTRKAQGEYEKAYLNYQSAFKVLSRRTARTLQNERSNFIYPQYDYEHNLWITSAFEGAMHIAALSDGIEGVAIPTDELAKEELSTRQHDGLYWVDQNDTEGKLTRLFLPNYFNTFFVRLASDYSYSTIIGNMSTVLDLLGRHEEAQEHYEEANFIMSFHDSHKLGELRR